MRKYISKYIGMLLVTFSLQFNTGVIAQITSHLYPEIGDQMPQFMLNDIHYYYKKTASSTSFRGKPLILDFFSAGCSSCFAGFTHLDSLKRKFSNEIQFMLVAKQSPGLQRQYEKYMQHYHLDLPLDYDDSTIWNQFGVFQVPYTLWVDSSGIIRQISTSYGLNEDRINKFLEGKKQTLVAGSTQEDKKLDEAGNKYYDYKKPFLIDGNGGSDTSYFFRSVLAKWQPMGDVFRDVFISHQNGNHINEIGVSLETLYMMAYGDTINAITPPSDSSDFGYLNHYGLWASAPVIEVANKTEFYFDFASATNIYSYSLTIPESAGGAGNLQRIMQSDLKNYFHYNVKIETRKWPCWKIVLDKNSEKDLKTKGGKTSVNGDFYSMTLKNCPVSTLQLLIWSWSQNDPELILDSTKINYNIDLNMNCVWTDLDDVKNELNKNGLDLIRGETDVKAIVIRDEQKL